MSVLVLGGYGAVGGHLVRLLRATGVTASAAGRDAARADRVVDLGMPGSFEAALAGVTVVVNCAGAEDIRLAEICARRAIVYVDISATSDHVRALERIPGPVLLGVGLAPGLSTLLAADALSSCPGPVDVMIGLGAGEQHGAAATEWTYGLLGRSFLDPDGTRIRNFTRPARFPIPGAAGYAPFPALRADFADQHRLTREFATPVRTYVRLDSRFATAGLAGLTRAPGLRALVPARMFGGDTWVVIARAADGTHRWATGRGQSLATAAVAAVLVRESSRRRITRATWIHEILDAATLWGELSAYDLELRHS